MSPDTEPLVPPRDAIAAVTHPDPYPYYARLVAERPFAFAPESQLFVAASAAACEAVLANPACGVRPAAEQVPRALAGSAVGELWARWARMTDGARHAPLKRAIVASLATVTADEIEGAARRAAHALLRDTTGAPRAWLDGFVHELAPHTLAELLGFAGEAAARLTDATRHLVRATAAGADGDRLARGESAARELADAMRERAHDTARSPRGLAQKLMACVAHEGLAPDDAIANAIALLWQPFDAGGAGLGNAIVALARRPELRARVARERGLLPAVVAEGLRFDPAVHNTRRFVAGSCSIAGVPLAAGDTVLVVLAAANRDPARFAEPDRFEPERDGGATLAFGSGPHHCPGGGLASAIIVAGLEALLNLPAERALAWDELAVVAYRPLPNVRIPRFAAAEQELG